MRIGSEHGIHGRFARFIIGIFTDLQVFLLAIGIEKKKVVPMTQIKTLVGGENCIVLLSGVVGPLWV